MSTQKNLADWERVLASAAHLQKIVLVGGTAAAAHAHHRLSNDADHIVTDLRTRFDQILAELQSVAGWKTARVNRPVLILGSLDGIETGIRQLIRTEPLETTQISIGHDKVTLPTEGEMLRIKAALILKRNATRDYIDFVALADHLGAPGVYVALDRLDSLYPQANGESALQQLQIQLSNPLPFDLEATRLSEYKNLEPKWHDWNQVKRFCAATAIALFESEKQ